MSFQQQRRKRITIGEIHKTSFPTKKRIPIPLHRYLEEIKNDPKKTDIGMQCDEFNDKEIEGEYIPLKTGEDRSIQVDTQNIFEFDRDVKPIVDLIVDKTIEQAIMEIKHYNVYKLLDREENSLIHKKDEEEKILKKRIKDEENRVRLKNERRDRARKKKQDILNLFDKSNKLLQSQNIIKNIKNRCFNHLQYLYLQRTDINIEIEDYTIPYLKNETVNRLDIWKKSKIILDEIIKNSIVNLQEIRREAQEKMKKIRVRLRVENQEIGPIILECNSTINDLRTIIFKSHNTDKLNIENIDNIELYSNQNLLKLEEYVKDIDQSQITVNIIRTIKNNNDEDVVADEKEDPET